MFVSDVYDKSLFRSAQKGSLRR